LHRERAADAADRRAVRGEADRLGRRAGRREGTSAGTQEGQEGRMGRKLNRREFVQTTTAATVAAAAMPATLFGQGPTIIMRKSVKPVVISSSNGHQFKNGGSKTCVETAFSMITSGADVL